MSAQYRWSVGLIVAVVGIVWGAAGGASAAQAEWVTDQGKLWKVVDGALVEAGKLVFTDRFEGGPKPSSAWKLDGAHVWRVADGVMSNTSYGGHAVLTKDLGEGFVVEIKVKPLAEEPGKEGGFTGINVGGLLCVCQPGRWWWSYGKKGETRSTGSWKTEPVPYDRWYQFTVVREPGGAYSWYVDGRLIVQLVEPGITGGLALQGWRVKAMYSDVKVYKMHPPAPGKAGGEQGINLIRNGSFEQNNDDIPRLWGPTRFRDIPTQFGSLETFHESWTIDPAERKDGAVSMRLGGGGQKNGLQSYFCNVPIGQPCVLTAWLKSESNALPVELYIQPGARQVVTATREWTRHTVVLSNAPASRLRAVIAPRTGGRVWVDAVQLEAGMVPSAFHTNPLDVDGGKGLAEDPIPTYRLPTVRTPVIDGKLDDRAWGRRSRLPELRLPTAFPGKYHKATEPTEVYLCHDADTLYAAFRCHVAPGLTNAPGAGDEVELFIDPSLSRTTYYRFRVNAAGQRNQDRELDRSWNPPWTAVTGREEGAWTVEIAIPLASLELGPLTREEWGVNLCRANMRVSEQACLAPVVNRGMYFHNAARYPVFKWDKPAVLEPHRAAGKNRPVKGVVAVSTTNFVPRFIQVDGKPFFAFAPLQVFGLPSTVPYGDFDKTIETVMDYWRTNGFTTLDIGANADAEKGRWGERIFEKALSYADTHGMKLVLFWTGPWYAVFRDPPRMEALVKRLKDHPSLLAWQAADEPEIYAVKPEEVAEGVRRLKALDPNHPVYINYTQIGPVSGYAGLPGDIMSLDYYLTSSEGRTIAETLRQVDAMEAVARPRGIPTWNFLIGSFPEYHWREISADEQTAQVYGNIVRGASGFTYFLGQVMGLEHWARLKQLNAEMQELTPILASAEPVGPAATSDPAVLVTARRHGGKVYVIAVNIEDRAIPASINVAGVGPLKEQPGDVLFEKRPIPVEGGVLRDQFRPFERHVYTMDLRP